MRIPHARRTSFLTLALLAMFLAGCQTIQWRHFDFETTYREAQRDDKLTFVFFRAWYLVASGEFEQDVLNDPAIIAATQDYYCAKVEFSTAIDRPLALMWGIDEPPAVAIVAPNRDVLLTMQGTIDRDELLAALRKHAADFRAARGLSTKPASATDMPSSNTSLPNSSLPSSSLPSSSVPAKSQ